MFKIGDFSKLAFVSIRMLRYYDEIGLFKPHHIDTFTNYRYYSATQIPVLNKIIGLKNLGFNAEEIKQIIREDNNDKQIKLLKSKQKDLTKQLHDDEERLKRLERFINDYNKEERHLKFEAVLKKVPSYKVVTYKATMKNYTDEGALWGKMMELAKKHKLFGNFVQSGMCYARFFEEDLVEGRIEIEIGEEVHTLGTDVDGLEYKEIEPMEEALSVLVTGDYVPNIQEGFNFVAKHIEENNFSIIGPPRTVYVKGPGDETNPDNYITEIQVPIKKN